MREIESNELKFPDKFKIMIGVNKNVRKRAFSIKNIIYE